jgi:CheY-like chemotaxis protein
VISGTVELALMTTAPDNPLRADLEEIQVAAQRGATLTGQLLAMSRQQILQPEVLDLNAVLRKMDGILRRLIGEDITLEMTLSDAPAGVRADPNQLEQVILNLVLNARDAMPDGGTVAIDTRVIDPATNSFAQPPSDGFRGPHVMLSVADTGVGMDEATRKRIFEPFFTTKELGKGTGLGLSMVYGAVEQCGGAVVAESEPGSGTVMRIYLPRMADAADNAPSDEPGEPPGGTETILLVEDEPAIRSLTQRSLAAAGYIVLEAGDGAEALERLAAHTGSVDLLLTDIVMPGMNGRELAARVVKARPGVKVLYTSGYTDDAMLRRGVLADPRRFIPKPYTPQQLQRKVRDVLDSY